MVDAKTTLYYDIRYKIAGQTPYRHFRKRYTDIPCQLADIRPTSKVLINQA